MTSNTDRLPARPCRTVFGRVFTVLFLLLCCCVCLHAQREILFEYEFKGNHLIGKVKVDLRHGNVSKIESGEIELSGKEDAFLLLFYDLEMKENLHYQGAQLVMRSDFLRVTGGIQLEPTFQMETYKTGRRPMQIPVLMTKEGDAKIIVKNLAIEMPDGQEQEVNPGTPFSIPVRVRKKTQDIAKTPGTETLPPPDSAGRNNKQPITPPPAPPAPPAVVEDPVKKKYESIMNGSKAGREEKLKAFINEYPNSPLAKKAMRDVATERVFGQEGAGGELVYDIHLKYAIEPVVDFNSDTGKVIVEPMKKGRDYWLHITLLEDGDYTLSIRDSLKAAPFDRFSIQLGNILRLALLPVSGDTSLALKLSKGLPPFRLDFFRKGERITSIENIGTDTSLYFDLAFLKNLLNDESGEYSVRVVEQKRNHLFEAGGFSIEGKRFPWEIAGIAALLIVLLAAINFLRKRSKHRQYAAKVKLAEENKLTALADSNGAGPEYFTATAPAMENEDAQAEKPLNAPASSVIIRNMKKAAGQTPKGSMDETAFAQQTASSHYYKMDMTRLWPDTAISELHFHAKSIADLDRFLRSQNIHEIKEQEGTVPEIGGFLLGRYALESSTKQYKLAVEEFVPVSPQMHNVYQLEFSTGSIVRELGDAQEQFPDLALVAWFHTHPGHGLFLSNPDLTIHDGFFKEKYQFAMEIDSLTENLDTGFFTRQLSGQVNNRKDLRPEARWFDWTQIEKAGRRG